MYKRNLEKSPKSFFDFFNSTREPVVMPFPKLPPDREEQMNITFVPRMDSDNEIDIDKVKLALENINKNWDKKARVRDAKMDYEELPIFDISKPDFREEFLPFSTHPLYLDASQEMKNKILTCGWLIYNTKTEHIETKIVNPSCTDIICGKVPGLKDAVSREIAAEAMTDESFHTLLVLRANNITESHRGFSLDLPDFELVKQLKRAHEELDYEWQKTLLTFVTAAVSEMHISDYLRKLSQDTTIQDINRMTVDAHYKDEIRHGSIFTQFMKCTYASLDQEKKEFFAKVLPEPLKWFSNPEFTVWESALQQIGFEDSKALIDECREQSNYANAIDYSKIITFANHNGMMESQKTIEHYEENGVISGATRSVL